MAASAGRGDGMFKVFLVEDEVVVREGIRNNIDWEQYGFRFAGDAPDQGTIGSTPQIGRTRALEEAVARHPNWELVAQECGDFTRAKAYEVMSDILEKTKDIDVVYCENDGNYQTFLCSRSC